MSQAYEDVKIPEYFTVHNQVSLIHSTGTLNNKFWHLFLISYLRHSQALAKIILLFKLQCI